MNSQDSPGEGGLVQRRRVSPGSSSSKVLYLILMHNFVLFFLKNPQNDMLQDHLNLYPSSLLESLACLSGGFAARVFPDILTFPFSITSRVPTPSALAPGRGLSRCTEQGFRSLLGGAL